METKLTFDLLPIIAVLSSILAWYVPKFKDWYDKLTSQNKQLFMVGLMALTVLVTVGLSALGFVDVYSGATWKEWVWYPLVDFVFAVIANAGTYKATNYALGKNSG